MESAIFTAPTSPASNADGTVTAIVAEPAQTLAGAAILALQLPAAAAPANARLAGRYFLARCGAQSEWERVHNWQIYLRRPLRVVKRRRLADQEAPADMWWLWAPQDEDPGFSWLRCLAPGAPVNLIGPLGNGFAILPNTRHLLLVAESSRAPGLLPLVELVLDRGGKVTLAVRDMGAGLDHLAPALPLAVELQVARSEAEWNSLLNDGVRWADQIGAALPLDSTAALAETIRQRRFRLDPGFALALVDADLACGYGACLACVVPLANSSLTRACVHGPVFDLVELAGE